MSNLYIEIFRLSGEHPSIFWLGLFGLISLVAWGSGQIVSRIVNWVLRRLTTRRTDEFYSLVVQPQQDFLKTVLILGLLDFVAYFILEFDLKARWYPYLEIPLTLAFTAALGWFLSRSFQAILRIICSTPPCAMAAKPIANCYCWLVLVQMPEFCSFWSLPLPKPIT
jgi:uncharacterized membrane protein